MRVTLGQGQDISMIMRAGDSPVLQPEQERRLVAGRKPRYMPLSSQLGAT